MVFSDKYCFLKNDLEYTTNIDVTTYVNGEKKKHNPDGKVYAPIIWDFFQVIV